MNSSKSLYLLVVIFIVIGGLCIYNYNDLSDKKQYQIGDERVEVTAQNKKQLRDVFRSFSEVDMLHGKIFKSLVMFAIPVFISMLFQNLYNLSLIHI